MRLSSFGGGFSADSVSLKLLFTSTGANSKSWEGPGYVEAMKKSLELCSKSTHRFVDDPEEADLIVFFEPHYYKTRDYARLLKSETCINRFPNKCFVVNYDDYPIGYLPGVYVAMSRRHMDRNRFRAGVFPVTANAYCERYFREQRHVVPEYLFSFRGARSASVRDAIFANQERLRQDSIIVETFSWYQNSEEQSHRYVEEILQSKFVLCPRGLGTASHRLFEAMQLGRVPVILSDHWVEPDGPEWERFSMRLPESDILKLPELLRSFEDQAWNMGRLARKAWEEWFSPKIRVYRTIGYLQDILTSRLLDEGDYQRRWLERSFYNQYRGSLMERVRRSVRRGIHRRRMKRHRAVRK